MIRLSWLAHTHARNKISNILPQYVWKADNKFTRPLFDWRYVPILSNKKQSQQPKTKKIAKISTHQISKRLLIHYASLKFQIGPSNSCRLQFTRHLICASWKWALRTLRTQKKKILQVRKIWQSTTHTCSQFKVNNLISLFQSLTLRGLHVPNKREMMSSRKR